MKELKQPYKKRWGKWVCAFFLLSVFALIAQDIDNVLMNAVDRFFYYQVAKKVMKPALTLFLKIISYLGYPLTLLVISFFLVFFIRRKVYIIGIWLNFVTTLALNISLKAAFLRGRPVDVVQLIKETGYSFPSGHSMAAAAFWGFLIFLVWHENRSKRKKIFYTVSCMLLIFLVGFSRVYLGVHYATDVIAGYCVSGAYLIIFTSVMERYLEKGDLAMQEEDNDGKRQSIVNSFRHAFEGMRDGLKNERNLMIHFSIACLVIIFGWIFQIKLYEWMVCICLFGLVIAMELINTAIEAVVDLCCPHFDEKAKIAKDTAAGAVLISAIAAAVIGLLIFVPKFLDLVATL